VLNRWCDPSRLSTQGIQLVISGISLHLYLPPRRFPFHSLSLQRLDDAQPSSYTPAWTRPHITPHAPSLSLLTMQREGVVCQNLQGHAHEPHRPFPSSHPSMPLAVILSNTCRATGRVDVSLCFRPMPTTTPLQKRSSCTGTQSHRPPLPNRWPSPSLFLTPACRPPRRRHHRAPHPGRSSAISKIKRYHESPSATEPLKTQLTLLSISPGTKSAPFFLSGRNRAGVRRSAARLERGCYLSSSTPPIFPPFNPGLYP
jgi:hypothetical protein